MLFNSLTFVLFFLIVIAAYYGSKKWSTRKSILLFASYVFYAVWNPPFILLLWLSTIIDWVAHRKIHETNSKFSKKIYLIISLITNLGLLGYFKYGNFILENFILITGKLGLAFSPPKLDIILPVGISFYTFQTLSCTIDVYRNKIKPVSSFTDFALYVTFFPQLVAGPIVRIDELVPQFEVAKKFDSQKFCWGCFLLTLGLFQKMVLADTLLAPISDQVFSYPKPLYALDSWVGTLAFTCQIFFDFAGYSICAIGAALCLGFSLPDNFKSPYASLGFADFWKRWHITLSTWLRDYLYIPLGGNQHGFVRTLINLSITMFLGGLWHGASWNFVIWGLIHGFYLILERVLISIFKDNPILKSSIAKFILILTTFFMISIAWVFFRASDLPTALRMLTSMFSASPNEYDQILTTTNIYICFFLTFSLMLTHLLLRKKTVEDFANQLPLPIISTLWGAMLISILLTQGSGNAFLYFQF